MPACPPTNRLGMTALMRACERAYSSNAVSILIKAGAQVEKTCDDGKTALHFAFKALKEIHEIRTLAISQGVISRFHKRYCGSKGLLYRSKSETEEEQWKRENNGRWESAAGVSVGVVGFGGGLAKVSGMT